MDIVDINWNFKFAAMCLYIYAYSSYKMYNHYNNEVLCRL